MLRVLSLAEERIYYININSLHKISSLICKREQVIRFGYLRWFLNLHMSTIMSMIYQYALEIRNLYSMYAVLPVLKVHV